MNKSIGVLVLTKNRKKLLERAINSLLSQTELPDEVVIVNDGSTDETKNYLDGLNLGEIKLKIIHHHSSLGVNVSRNEGLRNIESYWAAILDDDDEFYPNAIKTMREKVQLVDEQYGMVFFNTFIEKDSISYVGGYQFKNDLDFYDPTYEEVMVKYGLRGDCKPLLKSSVFKSGEYAFPESVSSFESYTQKKMAKDGLKTRYYRDVLTHIYLQNDVIHVSNTASAQKPNEFLELHKEELLYHRDYYKKHPGEIAKKYISMMKLARRADKWRDVIKYFIYSFLSRLNIIILT